MDLVASEHMNAANVANSARGRDQARRSRRGDVGILGDLASAEAFRSISTHRHWNARAMSSGNSPQIWQARIASRQFRVSLSSAGVKLLVGPLFELAKPSKRENAARAAAIAVDRRVPRKSN
jgi:hypothetical protein